MVDHYLSVLSVIKTDLKSSQYVYKWRGEIRNGSKLVGWWEIVCCCVQCSVSVCVSITSDHFVHRSRRNTLTSISGCLHMFTVNQITTIDGIFCAVFFKRFIVNCIESIYIFVPYYLRMDLWCAQYINSINWCWNNIISVLNSVNKHLRCFFFLLSS